MSPSANAGTPPCQRHECSNDSTTAGAPPTYGDESLTWDPIPEWAWRPCLVDTDEPCFTDSTRRCYEVALLPGYRVLGRACELAHWVAQDKRWYYAPASHFFSPYRVEATDHPRWGLAYRYVARACVGPTCGEWSPMSKGGQDYVEFVGVDYLCLKHEGPVTCETPCYPGARKMLKAMPECTDASLAYHRRVVRFGLERRGTGGP